MRVRMLEDREIAGTDYQTGDELELDEAVARKLADWKIVEIL